MTKPEVIQMERLDNALDETFDYRRAHTVDQLRDLITSFAICEESPEDNEKSDNVVGFISYINIKYIL